jgi:hypothetical protein
MEIKKLSTITKIKIYRTFCKAFLNYFYPLTFDADETFERWRTLGVDFDASYGALADGELAAFVLHARRGDELYNFATGVVPEHRGKNLVARLYESVRPAVTLEVLKEHARAIRAYEKAGFDPGRELVTFTGTFAAGEAPARGLGYRIVPLAAAVAPPFAPLWAPAFENARPLLIRQPLHELHELLEGSAVLAYAIFTPSEGLVRELGARDVRAPILDQLFARMRFPGETIGFASVDARARSVLAYLESRNLRPYAEQFELRRPATF